MGKCEKRWEIVYWDVGGGEVRCGRGVRRGVGKCVEMWGEVK